MKLLILFILGIGVVCDEKEENNEPFIPTKEWQTVKKDQKVPSGLHYRINVNTGLVEAKLLEEKNEKTDVLEVPSQPKDEDLNLEDLKKMLKQMKHEETVSKQPVYRTYDEIKKELGSLNLISKIDAEVLEDLLKQHKNEMDKKEPNVDNIITILDDFDFLGHQFDNGLEFVRQNGFRDVVYKNLNSSNDVIKQKTLKLFGSLVQNNARVQIHALETGSIPVLLRILDTNSLEDILGHTVYAIGCLLRRFPLAQKKFVENGGVFIITQVFEKSSIKIQLKIVTLMTDLFIEKREALENSNALALNQYHNIPLEKELINQNWCYHINKLLNGIFKNYEDDHDSIEKCLVSMDVVSEQCKDHFNKSVLLLLQEKYRRLVEKDTGEDEFFHNVVKLCGKILNRIKEKTEL
ncbi:nucleotide exchange factor SIL1 [Diorhabda carinulata]|uniref:nucleotide exchange factor SIL1 n=1 Tax=Diorhabda carinulata TaxID=1163345 RepID=UPI0025A28569|nr:nucleotide exchange factor SIL1 [Diorhabda carinulata]